MRRGNDRSCLTRRALPHYRLSFTKVSSRQNHSSGPWLHFRVFIKVWISMFLLLIWSQQEPCHRPYFCRLIELLYFFIILWRTKYTCSERLYHDEGFEHHILMFDKQLTSSHSLFWITGFQRLMDSSALEVYSETNHNVQTGNEYTQRKLRTDASDVTNPWLMRIFISKDSFERVWALHTFLCTLAKLPV